MSGEKPEARREGGGGGGGGGGRGEGWVSTVEVNELMINQQTLLNDLYESLLADSKRRPSLIRDDAPIPPLQH